MSSSTTARAVECLRLRICAIIATANSDDEELLTAVAGLRRMGPEDFRRADDIFRQGNGTGALS